MIVGEAEFDGDREEQLCRGRQSMTLPRNPRHFQQTPRPPPPLLQQDDQLHSMRRSSFNRSVAPVSLQMQSAAELPNPLPPHIASCSSPDVPPPPPPLTTSTVAVPNNNGSCLDSGLGGSDSSSFTFAEMHQVHTSQ